MQRLKCTFTHFQLPQVVWCSPNSDICTLPTRTECHRWLGNVECWHKWNCNWIRPYTISTCKITGHHLQWQRHPILSCYVTRGVLVISRQQCTRVGPSCIIKCCGRFHVPPSIQVWAMRRSQWQLTRKTDLLDESVGKHLGYIFAMVHTVGYHLHIII